MKPFYKHLITSAWFAGLFGFILGVGLTGFVLFLDKYVPPQSGQGSTLLLLYIITTPEGCLSYLTGSAWPPPKQSWLPTFIINGVFSALLFFILASLFKLVLRKERINKYDSQ